MSLEYNSKIIEGLARFVHSPINLTFISFLEHFERTHNTYQTGPYWITWTSLNVFPIAKVPIDTKN